MLNELLSHLLTLDTTHTDAGTYTDSWTFAGNANYHSAVGTLTNIIRQATPAIFWARPVPITYGTGLSDDQLNAMANVPGTFTYNPDTGTVLSAGSHTLQATFTPSDAVNYTTATASVELVVTVREVNQAPVLAPIGDKNTDEGSLLSFTVTANDADLPANALTFSLVDPPAGASIDPATGVFSWTPNDSPGSYTITVRVTDNGTPALSDTRTFAVTVSNVAPSAAINGPATATVGQAVAFTLTASDASSVDQNAGFTFDIDWDADGEIDQTVTGPSGTQVNHTESG